MEEDDYESLPDVATPSDHMIAGAAAGILEHCIIYPVDVVKVNFYIWFFESYKSNLSMIYTVPELTPEFGNFKLLWNNYMLITK